MASPERIPFYSYEDLRHISEEFLIKHLLSGKIPVDIERLLEFDLGIDIIPFPSLLKSFDINAFISNDFEKIYVDEYLYTNLERPYRFTLAHELGHKVLHRSFFDRYKIDSLERYIEFISGISDDEYRLLETQANNFAGLLLVPSDSLRKHFDDQSRKIIHFISTNYKGKNRAGYLGTATELIAQRLSPIFNVHESPILIRIEKDRLSEKIP